MFLELREITGGISEEACAVRTPMIVRDDDLLKHGQMRDARGEYLTLRGIVFGPEEGLRRGGERREESIERRGRAQKKRLNMSSTGGKRGTREGKGLSSR